MFDCASVTNRKQINKLNSVQMEKRRIFNFLLIELVVSISSSNSALHASLVILTVLVRLRFRKMDAVCKINIVGERYKFSC